jgi:hypothetical protein
MIFIPSIFIYQSPHSSIFSTVPFSKAHFGQLEFRESFVKSLLGLDSGVKHSDFKSTCIPSFNEHTDLLKFNIS